MISVLSSAAATLILDGTLLQLDTGTSGYPVSSRLITSAGGIVCVSTVIVTLPKKSLLTLTGRLSRIHDKQNNNSYWTVQNHEILSRYSEIIINTFWYHV